MRWMGWAEFRISYSLWLFIFPHSFLVLSHLFLPNLLRIIEDGRPLMYVYVGRIKVHIGQIAGMDFGYREGVEVMMPAKQHCAEFLTASLCVCVRVCMFYLKCP